MSRFKESVIKVVNAIPRGQVASYGQVAVYVGIPRGARQVGWILNGLEGSTPVPWWRVVNNKGRISIKGSRYSAFDQKSLLENEGIPISKDLTFEIEKYRFTASKEFIQSMKLDPIYLDLIMNKFPFTKNYFQI